MILRRNQVQQEIYVICDDSRKGLCEKKSRKFRIEVGTKSRFVPMRERLSIMHTLQQSRCLFLLLLLVQILLCNANNNDWEMPPGFQQNIVARNAVNETLTSSPSVAFTLEPTKGVTPSPTITPSKMPTVSSSASPSFANTSRPSASPSKAPTSLPSYSPSLNPSSIPTTFPSTKPTFQPTKLPSSLPSQFPSILPSRLASNSPSSSPTVMPSSPPTTTSKPSQYPTNAPTDQPSEIPSSPPTPLPTYTNFISVKSTFLSFVTLDEPIDQGTLRASLFEQALESLTPNINDDSNKDRVTTKCEFIRTQSLGGRKLRGIKDRNLLERNVILSFTMEYSSRHVNVTDYDSDLKNWIEGNSVAYVNTLQGFTLSVTDSSIVVILEKTDAPTISPSKIPTISPSYRPSTSPTVLPTNLPTLKPSESPSLVPSVSPTLLPTALPSDSPTNIPSSMPSIDKNTAAKVGGSIGGVIGASALILVLALYFKRKRDNVDGSEIGTGPGLRAPGSHSNSPEVDVGVQFPVVTPGEDGFEVAQPGLDGSPEGGYESGDSFLSSGSDNNGRGDSDSDIDYGEDGTLVDEFDKYKDNNLEKMRDEMEGMNENFDGMMSLALTKALMDDMEDEDGVSDMDINPPSATEIEATVLCDINDWLKKKTSTSAEERRDFMQKTLNEMVAMVRRGIMSPEDASRTIHGSAALLGLQLAENLPETTLIVTGMRKQVTTDHVMKAFEEFGEIESVGVSTNERGFGVVRFRSPKSVQRARDKHRYGEIIVQDVAVSIRLLQADTMEVDLTRQYSNERRV
ncbi:hypothetical protein CTEN210_01374 [Chaetoceros tenuissimus]|uniref:Circumsporozoite protein n=1 Tax=Chaetoceros tenuissimus TaxID=426638 RepID=A0AAD3GZL2_9STRA|nr:hypothetical protein CTEN210_01374 [Chaetoceros tenuissimus]